MSAAENAALLVIKGIIFDLPKDDQDKIAEAAAKINAIVTEYEAAGIMAVALIGAEMAAQE